MIDNNTQWQPWGQPQLWQEAGHCRPPQLWRVWAGQADQHQEHYRRGHSGEIQIYFHPSSLASYSQQLPELALHLSSEASIRCCLTKTKTEIMELSSATSKKGRVIWLNAIVLMLIAWLTFTWIICLLLLIEVLVQAECVRWQLGLNKNSLGKATTKSGISLELLLSLVWN